MSDFEAVIGSDAAWQLTITDDDENPITTYDPSAVLAASCWPGDDQANLFSPTLTWIDATQGTIKLSVSAAQTASLLPAVYNLQISITANGLTAKKNLTGGLTLLPTPGSASALKVYCTYQDMQRVFRGLDEFQDGDLDQTGFAEQRAMARQWFDDLLYRHYRGATGGLTPHQRVLQNWGGTWRSARRSPFLQQHLDADHLLLANPSGQPNRIPRCCATYAVALVLRDQTGSHGDTSYQVMAARYANIANGLALGIAAEIDTNADGIAEIVVDLGVADVLNG